MLSANINLFPRFDNQLWRYFFDSQNVTQRESAVAAKLEDRKKENEWLCCVVCNHKVTYVSERISMFYGHSHTFTNPAGFIFHIGCFRNASGCVTVGNDNAEYSWFPGYTWRVSLCAQCKTHLGWGFHGSDNRFFGLILDRLSLNH